MTAARTASTLALIAALLAVSACGRRGDLDTPYQAELEARRAAEKAGVPLPPEPERPVEDRPFILDSLI